MPALPIRTDVPLGELRRLARRERDPWVGRRLLANANTLDGMSREAAARAAEIDRQAVLRAIVLQGPDPEADGVSTWPVVDLCRIAQERFGVSYSENGMARLLHALKLSWQTPRLQHKQTAPSSSTHSGETGLQRLPT